MMKRFLWLLVQCVVAIAVGSAAIYSGITKSGTLIGAWSFMGAYGFTIAVNWLMVRLERIRVRRRPKQERVANRG